MTDYRWIDYVPKDPLKNLEWRVRMREAALHDHGLQKALYDAAMQDLLFWFNAFCWVYEPRAKQKVKPFVTWPHQDPVFLGMDKAIDEAESTELPMDVLLDKSRAQGGTYGYLDVFIRRWRRDPMFSAGMVTRNEKLVDSRTDSDALLWKVDWSLRQLPYWVLPEGFDFDVHRSLSDHTFLNPENGAMISGYAAGQDVGRGGRKTVFACDEIGAADFVKGNKDQAVMDALHDVTNCIFLVSTFGADTGVFYKAATNKDSEGLHFVLDWKDNPTQNKLAYMIRQGVAVAVRPEDQAAVTEYVKNHPDRLKKLERRGYRMEGHVRSPWYDGRCMRDGATPRLIAKELDRDPSMVVGKLFNMAVLERMTKEKARLPVWEGVPVIVDGALRLKPQEGGPLKLWFRPGLDDAPPAGVFALAADIATGSGGPDAVNSALSGGNAVTGEQILEYTDRNISETRLARLAVAIATWLHDAKLIWEGTGSTGLRFANEVREQHYSNVWMRPRVDVRTREITEKPGWVNNSPRDKVELFDDFWVAMDEAKFTPRSEDMLKECAGWEWDGEKIVYHGEGHGDRSIAGGMCWKAIHDLARGGVDVIPGESQIVRWNTPAWRKQRREAAQRERDAEMERTGDWGDDGQYRELLEASEW